MESEALEDVCITQLPQEAAHWAWPVHCTLSAAAKVHGSHLCELLF